MSPSVYVHKLLQIDEEFEAFELMNPLEDEGFDNYEMEE